MAKGMQLYFKRAKCFVHSGEGTKKFLAQPANGPQLVPFWVAETATFKQGVKDGSIVNLTPPEQMPGYKPAPVAVEAEEAESEPVGEGSDDAESDATQGNVEAPFGGQPMTPVPPAPRVGGVRANSAKK